MTFGEDDVTVTVSLLFVVDDSLFEDNEILFAVLIVPREEEDLVIFADDIASITILDDDGESVEITHDLYISYKQLFRGDHWI